MASSMAESPPPTTAIGLPRKKYPSHVAHVDTPWPDSFRSEPMSSQRADAPVAMIRAAVVIFLPSCSAIVKGRCCRSTLVTFPCRTSVPKRSACARISVMRSGPMMPSRNPGQFSTIVVSINCPPASSPSMSRGDRLARAVYNAAVSPAGPEPITTTLRSATSVPSEVPFDHPRDVVLRRQPDNRIRKLPFLEQEQRGNAADGVTARHVGVLVHIELGDRRAAIELRRERVHRGCHPAAGS